LSTAAQLYEKSACFEKFMKKVGFDADFENPTLNVGPF